MHTVKLSNAELTFSTLSNYPKEEVFAKGERRKWKRIVLLVHGFPDNNASYAELIPALGALLEQSLFLAPLLRGYEVSSHAPFNKYTNNDLAGDIKAWIENLDHADVPVHIVGHDWGAVATYRAAKLYPDLFASATTLAIPHVTGIPAYKLLYPAALQLYLSSYMLTMQFASLYKHRFHNTDYLDSLWRYWSPTWKFSQETIQSVKSTLSENIDHATAYYRCLFNVFNLPQYVNVLDFSKVPFLILGGDQDGCMNRGLFEVGKEFLTDEGVVVDILEGVGHFLHREDPERVGVKVAEWIKRSEPERSEGEDKR